MKYYLNKNTFAYFIVFIQFIFIIGLIIYIYKSKDITNIVASINKTNIINNNNLSLYKTPISKELINLKEILGDEYNTESSILDPNDNYLYSGFDNLEYDNFDNNKNIVYFKVTDLDRSGVGNSRDYILGYNSKTNLVTCVDCKHIKVNIKNIWVSSDGNKIAYTTGYHGGANDNHQWIEVYDKSTDSRYSME